MTQAGGPAAINGFLYQIIQHLGWIVDVSLSGKTDGQVVQDALLVLEPLGGGGDARAMSTNGYLVEQYKTREGGTWALSAIETVLRDLRKAVPSALPDNANYKFVTDGRAGRLDSFNKFLGNVKSASSFDGLDDQKYKIFRNGFSGTDREFFNHLVVVTRSGTGQLISDEHAAVFHLLNHFDMKFDADADALAASVEKSLRPYAPDLGQESKIREHLVGLLVKNLSAGEMRLDSCAIDDMLKHVGLSPERMRRREGLAEAMRLLTHSRLNRLKYQSSQDVRDIPEWPADKPVLVITGESGAGKTWQLGSLLETLGQDHEIATLVTSAMSRDELLSSVAEDIWQTGLNETSDKTLVAVSHFLCELDPNNASTRVVIGLDDVQDVNFATGLVLHDWIDLGMRLVLTAPQSVAKSLQWAHEDIVHLHTVGEFSIEELDALLKKGGQRWVDLPQDLQKILRNPILAGLFLKLPYDSFQGSPQSEYEIFEHFWLRISAKGRSGDEGIVVALAKQFLEVGLYPLPKPGWKEIGLDDQNDYMRLEVAGWLRLDGNSEVSFAHDRLLNWAAAKCLVQQFQGNQLTIEELGKILVGDRGVVHLVKPRHLGYLPMDVLWLLADDEQHIASLNQLVGLLEDSGDFGSYGNDLYIRHVPTLGHRAISILIDRLNTITAGSENDFRVSLIGKAFAALAQLDIDLNDAIDGLLNSTSSDNQNVALAALTLKPNAASIDRLWELHQQRIDALQEKGNLSRHKDYEDSFNALSAALPLDPGWLRNRIVSADENKERISALGYLLNRLEHKDAPTIWNEVGDILMAKTPTSKPRSLLYCIARFSDRERLDFVVQHLTISEDFASGAALTTLSALDPQLAIDRLVEVGEGERYMTRNNWLPILLNLEPELTCKHILKLAEADPKGKRLVETLFSERPDEMNESLFKFLLQALERDLPEHIEANAKGEPTRLHLTFELLGNVSRHDFLLILQEHAGGELERMITEVACGRLNRNSNFRDHILESARRVLILIAGEGIVTLIQRELESEHFWVRHGGLNWAHICADKGITKQLAAIALRPALSDADNELRSEAKQEFHAATKALAALGEDSVLVEILWQNGVSGIPLDLAWLRQHRGQMAKGLTESALKTLQSVQPAENSLNTAIAIAWLSGDADMIPAVRTVLEQANPEDQTAAYACLALQALGDSSAEFAQLAGKLARTRVNSQRGVTALLNMGKFGLKQLADWLKEQRSSEYTNHKGNAIRALYNNPTTRNLAVDEAVDCCSHGSPMLDRPYDIAAEAAGLSLREQIFDKAFSAHSSITAQYLRAIEGLAKFNVIRAVEAIEVGLRNHPGVERQLCQLLVRITPDTAATKLIHAAISINRKSLVPAVGRSLRRLELEIVSPLIIGKMKGSTSERKIAIELAGWLPTPEIAETLSNAVIRDPEVKYIAINALTLQSQERIVSSLFTEFPSASARKRWCLLLTILNAADAYLLTMPEDPLWLGAILSDSVPTALNDHAESVLRQRKQKED